MSKQKLAQINENNRKKKRVSFLHNSTNTAREPKT